MAVISKRITYLLTYLLTYLVVALQAEDCIQPACFTKDLSVVILSRDARFHPSLYVTCVIVSSLLYDLHVFSLLNDGKIQLISARLRESYLYCK